MIKKNMVFLSSVLIIFIFIWAVCIGVIFKAGEQAANKYIEKGADTAALDLDRMLERQVSDLRSYMKAYNAQGFRDVESLYPILDDVSTMYPDHELYIMDTQGELYAGGTNVSISLGQSAVKTAQDLGYAIISVESMNSAGKRVAMIVGQSNDSPFFFVRLESLKAFVDRVFSVAFSSEYYALYDEWGRVVLPSGIPASNEIVDSVQTAALDYARNRSTASLKRMDWGRHYFVTIPLGQPTNWFIGARVSADEVIPSFTSIVFSLIVLFLACNVFLGVVLFFGFRHWGRLAAEKPETSLEDPLTGLTMAANHESELEAFFKKEPLKGYCLIYMDISAFRRFNTMFGHVIGDKLLRVVGQCIKENYLCGVRLNSDVFAFVVKANGRIIEDIENILAQAIQRNIGGQYVGMISFKFGVYPLLQDKLNYREASDGALLALKNAKSLPKQTEVVYDHAMLKADRMRKFIEMNMMYALSKGEFELYVQPKFRVSDVKCCGGEALVRWRSEQMGFLAPSQFVPLFEQNGFIADIDFFMLTQILTLLQEAQDSGKQLFPLSVNQSRVTISFPNYLDRLKELVKNYTVPLHYIELEITESILTENYDLVVMLVHEMHEIGFSVAMDDFGKGYSSLNTLRELPFDVLKIDKEFLLESDNSHRGRKIIQSVINMSKDLDLNTVCEGVETGMQLDFLKMAGCDVVQGYYLSKPIPSQEYAKRYLHRNIAI